MQTAGPVGSRPPAPLTTGRVRLAPRTCVLFTMKFMFTPMFTPCLLNPRSACSGAGSAPWWRPGPPYCRHRCQRYSMPCAVCRALSLFALNVPGSLELLHVITRAVTSTYHCQRHTWEQRRLPAAQAAAQSVPGPKTRGPGSRERLVLCPTSSTPVRDSSTRATQTRLPLRIHSLYT